MFEPRVWTQLKRRYPHHKSLQALIHQSYEKLLKLIKKEKGEVKVKTKLIFTGSYPLTTFEAIRHVFERLSDLSSCHVEIDFECLATIEIIHYLFERCKDELDVSGHLSLVDDEDGNGGLSLTDNMSMEWFNKWLNTMINISHDLDLISRPYGYLGLVFEVTITDHYNKD
ncbi:hypothetical protein [Chemarfal virus 1]|nr:hypothetical protein [Chemarfal virus 1]WPR17941.1 MAG: hypothetical protein [Chemarfal virus 1]